MRSIEVPVLIVGGGGCGLSSSIFLSRLGIESLLVERHATPSPMPKARYLNQRTMEIFRQHDLAGAIYQRSMPLRYIQTMRWATSLGGDGPLDRKTLFELDSFGGGADGADYAADSPCESTIYPQVRLEPLLREAAKSARSEPSAPPVPSPNAATGAGRLMYHCEFQTLAQDAEGVTATVLDRGSGETFQVRSQYLIAADANKSVGPLVGVKLEGTPDLLDMVTVYFAADLSNYVDADYAMTYWFANTEGDTSSWGSGVLGKLGPTRFDRHSEEWMFHFSFPPGQSKSVDQASLVPRIRQLLKVPELEPKILGIGHWTVQGVLANRYRFGRVFIAGDAAHRHTPTTGLGLNSAIQDAHNLCWKLALAVKGQAGDALLDSYETERRPVGRRNVDWALFTFSNHRITGAAIGMVPGDPKTTADNFAALLAPGADGEARRKRFNDVMTIAHRTEFQAHDLEIGFRYEQGALVPDGSAAPAIDPTGRRYLPTTRAGARLPHAWVRQQDQWLSTLDLVQPGRFTLLIGEYPKQSPHIAIWTAAAQAASEGFGVPIAVVIISEATAEGLKAHRHNGADQVDRTEGGNYDDGSYGGGGGGYDGGGAKTRPWRELREVSESGAVLVRPDQHVGWRAHDQDAACALSDAFAQILGRAAKLNRA